MSDYIKAGVRIAWLIVLLYWIISAFRSKKVKQEEALYLRFLQYWLPLIIAGLLLGPGEWFGHFFLRENFVPHNNLVGSIGLSICIAGAFICCWSRYTLGKNWSLAVQQKQDHELIQTGIYKTIRHPIYTGLLLLFTGNAIVVGDYRGILAVVIVFVSFWFKLRKEEKWLTAFFGNEYAEYKARTKALIPFLL